MYKLFNALAAMGICFGALFKIQHYPGASVLLLSGLFLRIVGYLITPKEIRSLNPLTSITNQNTFVQITNGISIALILVGALFKIQHYPGASIMTSGFINRSSGKSVPSKLEVNVAPGNIAVTLTSCSFISSRRTLVIPYIAYLLIQ